MSTEAQREEKLRHASIWDSPLGEVVQATEEQRALMQAQATAQRVQTNLHLAELLSLGGAFNGTDRAPKTEAEREQAKHLAFAQIQIGEEIGLKPAQSMRSIMITPQGIEIDIHTRVALAIASGRHDYDILRHDRDVCEIQWKRKRNGQWETCPPIKADIEQLKGIMVWEYDSAQKKPVRKPITEKWNYREWREDMTYRFAMIRCLRRYAPETQGAFPIAREETGEVPGDQGMAPTDAQATVIRDEISPPRTDPTAHTAVRPPLELEPEAYEDAQEATNTTEDDREDPESTQGDSEAPSKEQTPETHDPFAKQRAEIHEAVGSRTGTPIPLPRSRFLEEGQTQHLEFYDWLMGAYRTCRDEDQMDTMVAWVRKRLAAEEC